MILRTNELLQMHKPPDGCDALKMLEYGRYVSRLMSGYYAFLPLGRKALDNLEKVVREIVADFNFLEISTPILQDKTLWLESGRYEQYRDGIFTVADGKREYVIGPTCEELVLELSKNWSGKPYRIFQLGEKVRNEPRPAFGLLRACSFILADCYIVCESDGQLDEQVLLMQELVEKICKSLVPKYGVAMRAKKAQTFSYWLTLKHAKQCAVWVCGECDESYRDERLDLCPNCGGEVTAIDAVEIADVTCHRDLKLVTAGVGISRLLQVLAEVYATKTGFCWPEEIAPYRVEILANEERTEEAVLLHDKLCKLGCEALADIRSDSMGRKLVDADLIGAPIRVILGKNTASPNFEVIDREVGKRFVMQKYRLLQYLQVER